MEHLEIIRSKIILDYNEKHFAEKLNFWRFKNKKIVFTRPEMFELNKKILLKRGVTIDSIAEITFQQQSKYTDNISRSICLESVEKILSLRDVFHHVQLACEIDRLAEEKMFQGPIQDIIYEDLGLFGIDETMGLDVSGLYGTIGQTNFGDISLGGYSTNAVQCVIT
jgi:phosphatidylglycerophosphatase A